MIFFDSVLCPFGVYFVLLNLCRSLVYALQDYSRDPSSLKLYAGQDLWSLSGHVITAILERHLASAEVASEGDEQQAVITAQTVFGDVP